MEADRTVAHTRVQPDLEIIRRARDFTTSLNVEVGVLPYGDDVVHNSWPYKKAINSVEYKFAFSVASNYEIWVEYAAGEPHPCQILWDGTEMPGLHMASTTNGLDEAPQVYEMQTFVYGLAGVHTLQIFRRDVFPHIRNIKLKYLGG